MQPPAGQASQPLHKRGQTHNPNVQGSLYQCPCNNWQQIPLATMGQAHISSWEYTQLDASITHWPNCVNLWSHLGSIRLELLLPHTPRMQGGDIPIPWHTRIVGKPWNQCVVPQPFGGPVDHYQCNNYFVTKMRANQISGSAELISLKKPACSYLLYLIISSVFGQKGGLYKRYFCKRIIRNPRAGRAVRVPCCHACKFDALTRITFSRPATAFISFSALILLNHDKKGLGLHEWPLQLWPTVFTHITRSPLPYGSISSVHQTHLTPCEEWRRNDDHDTTAGRCIQQLIRPAMAILSCALCERQQLGPRKWQETSTTRIIFSFGLTMPWAFWTT